MKVDLESGRARIEVEDEGMDPRKIPGAIREAGFTPGRIEIEVVGEVRSSEEGRVLQLSVGPLELLPLSGEMARGLEPGHKLRLSGELEYPEKGEDGPYRLRVEGAEEVEAR